jgi:hypothetical protein
MEPAKTTEGLDWKTNSHGNCHNSFLSYSPNSLFLFQKIKNIFGLKTKKNPKK